MKMLWVIAFLGLSLIDAVNSASAQRRGRDYGYDERDYGSHSYGERDAGDHRYDDDDDRFHEQGRSYDNSRGGERSRSYNEDLKQHPDRRRNNDNWKRDYNRGTEVESEAEFDEDEYLRCNPDVARAVKLGKMASGYLHYRTFGRRERRQLICPMKV